MILSPIFMIRCCCLDAMSCLTFFVTPWTVAHQAPLSMGFPKQEYWSGLRFPPPGDLPGPGHASCAGRWILYHWATWEALFSWLGKLKSKCEVTCLGYQGASRLAQWVKDPPAIQKTQEMQVWSDGSGRSPRRGNGNPLQYSCLENPVDRGAWWATVHRVAKSRTRLKQLSMHRVPESGRMETRFKSRAPYYKIWAFPTHSYFPNRSFRA